MDTKQKHIFSFFSLCLLTLSACAPVLSPQLGTITPSTDLPISGTSQVDTDARVGPTQTISILERYYVPTYYSPFYSEIVEGSKSENGLLIYSTMSAENWKPIIRIFQEHYPWINVIALNLDSKQIFERYHNEIGNNSPTADVIISTDISGWQTLIKEGQVLSYRSQEDEFLPSWAKGVVGIYAVSSDPLVIIYNKGLVNTAPETIEQIGQLADKFPEQYNAKIVTFDGELNATGFSINWNWTKSNGDAGWNSLNAIGNAHPIFRASDTEIISEVGTGNASIGYFVLVTSVLQNEQKFPELGWSYIKDRQPIFIRDMAITQGNANPNSAKLMVDFLLSQEGQLALSLGGLTPYRNDISQTSQFHLQKTAAEVGSENLIFLTLDSQNLDPDALQRYIDYWKLAMDNSE